MRIIAATCLCVALSFITPRVSDAQAEVPDFFTSLEVDTAQLASAVNHFVELGETKAFDALKEIRSRQTFSGKIDGHFRLACICRVLWQNSDNPIPPPHLGMYGGGVSVGAGQSAKLKDWPMFPVAKAGNSYFIVVYDGRFGTGMSRSLPIGYFTQCQTSGSFLTEKISVPAKEDAEIDARQLRQSAHWINEFPGQGADREAWRSIESQIPNNAR